MDKEQFIAATAIGLFSNAKYVIETDTQDRINTAKRVYESASILWEEHCNRFPLNKEILEVDNDIQKFKGIVLCVNNLLSFNKGTEYEVDLEIHINAGIKLYYQEIIQSYTNIDGFNKDFRIIKRL